MGAAAVLELRRSRMLVHSEAGDRSAVLRVPGEKRWVHERISRGARVAAARRRDEGYRSEGNAARSSLTQGRTTDHTSIEKDDLRTYEVAKMSSQPGGPARCSVLSAQCSVLSAQCSVPTEKEALTEARHVAYLQHFVHGAHMTSLPRAVSPRLPSILAWPNARRAHFSIAGAHRGQAMRTAGLHAVCKAPSTAALVFGSPRYMVGPDGDSIGGPAADVRVCLKPTGIRRRELCRRRAGIRCPLGCKKRTARSIRLLRADARFHVAAVVASRTELRAIRTAPRVGCVAKSLVGVASPIGPGRLFGHVQELGVLHWSIPRVLEVRDARPLVAHRQVGAGAASSERRGVLLLRPWNGTLKPLGSAHASGVETGAHGDACRAKLGCSVWLKAAAAWRETPVLPNGATKVAGGKRVQGIAWWSRHAEEVGDGLVAAELRVGVRKRCQSAPVPEEEAIAHSTRHDHTAILVQLTQKLRLGFVHEPTAVAAVAIPSPGIKLRVATCGQCVVLRLGISREQRGRRAGVLPGGVVVVGRLAAVQKLVGDGRSVAHLAVATTRFARTGAALVVLQDATATTWRILLHGAPQLLCGGVERLLELLKIRCEHVEEAAAPIRGGGCAAVVPLAKTRGRSGHGAREVEAVGSGGTVAEVGVVSVKVHRRREHVFVKVDAGGRVPVDDDGVFAGAAVDLEGSLVKRRATDRCVMSFAAGVFPAEAVGAQAVDREVSFYVLVPIEPVGPVVLSKVPRRLPAVRQAHAVVDRVLYLGGEVAVLLPVDVEELPRQKRVQTQRVLVALVERLVQVDGQGALGGSLGEADVLALEVLRHRRTGASTDFEA
eukprot:scaffold8036_cov267-Pinguiococcus_pyrenoidosus.AAC.2